MATSYYTANPAIGRETQPAPSRADPCADPRPPCPVCGGLKCLCRPRFFPGQLLSDDDLNGLEQYVIDKNRLHNRHLVGWGVACGLEVACNPCDSGAVTVRAGYALAPCGDDIVLCADQAVDICQLVQSCRPANPVVCDPPYSNPPSQCGQGVERWVLAVCYDERPSRGITALTGADDSVAQTGCRCGGSTGCSCGGAGKAGGCGCNSAGSTGCSCAGTRSAYQPSGTRRKLLPQCEPTQICEGFRFTAYPAPAPSVGLLGHLPNPKSDQTGASGDLMIAWLFANRSRFGPLLERALCCVMRAMDLRATLVEGRQIDAAGIVGSYRDYAQALEQFAAEFSLHHCSFVGSVRTQFDDAVSWSRTRMSGQLSAPEKIELASRFVQLDQSWMQIVTECFCSALLPACPAPANSNCVPLAVVTVNTGTTTTTTSTGTITSAGTGGACRVIDICNWQERKLLITWPTIQYWLSWLPWQALRTFIARICCSNGERNTGYQMMAAMLGLAMAGARGSSALPQVVGTVPGTGFSTVDATARATVSRTTAASAARTTDSATTPPSEPAPGSFEAAMAAPNLLRHMLADYEQARVGGASAPAWAALAARVFDGSAFAPLAGNAAVRDVDTTDLDKHLGVDAMRSQLAELQKTVARQDEILRALQIVKGQAS